MRRRGLAFGSWRRFFRGRESGFGSGFAFREDGEELLDFVLVVFGQVAAVGVRHCESVSTREGGCGWSCCEGLCVVESGDVLREVEVERGKCHD